MKHKIYTTYLSKMKYVPENTMKVIVMRFPPFLKEAEDMIHSPNLSPTNELFSAYKKNNDWEDFEKKFKEQMYSLKETMDTIDELIEALDSEDGNDICLICCEKDNTFCHRRLLAEYLQSLGYEWEEL